MYAHEELPKWLPQGKQDYIGQLNVSRFEIIKSSLGYPYSICIWFAYEAENYVSMQLNYFHSQQIQNIISTERCFSDEIIILLFGFNLFLDCSTTIFIYSESGS
jgi:hypothetical protein